MANVLHHEKDFCWDIPTERPTVEEWRDLGSFIANLYQTKPNQPAFLIQQPYGIGVCSYPAESYDKELPVRYQKFEIIPGIGMIVEWDADLDTSMTVPEFMREVARFFADVCRTFGLDVTADVTLPLEDFLWRFCELPPDKAAMLRIPYLTNVVHPEIICAEEPNVNLKMWSSKLLLSEGRVEGITIPTTYVGCPLSVFEMHIESSSLAAANFQTSGAPKIWYIGDPDKVDSYAEAIRVVFHDIHRQLDETGCDQYWRHKILMIKPSFLANSPKLKELNLTNLKMFRLVQHVGQLVVVRSDAIHMGINCGASSNTAVNIPDPNWKRNSKSTPDCSSKCSLRREERHPYRISQQAIENSDFDTILGGIEFSRPASDYPAELWLRDNHNRTCLHNNSPEFPHCFKAFAKPAELERHNRAIHSASADQRERNYKCETCQESYLQPSHLRQHQQKHMEEKHKCDKCGQEFSFLNSLVKHKKKCSAAV